MTGRDAFVPVGPRRRHVFVDSSALFAFFHPGDEHQDRTRTFYDGIDDGGLPYKRLVTNEFVLDEVATRLRHRVSHARALMALSTVVGNYLYAIEFTTPAVFHSARERFDTFDDHSLSFTDCTIVSHMDDLDLDHLLSYDSDFSAFDCTVIPHYVS